MELHPHAINEKIRTWWSTSRPRPGRIGGKAKAMIVTRSRLHALRYKLAMDRYLEGARYPFKALVAFSGTVKDGGKSYTEAGMNGAPRDRQTAKEFERPENRFLIVANKFQTGFDQPLLHTMYVDKKLGGVNAVQTLSRLNRMPPRKTTPWCWISRTRRTRSRRPSNHTTRRPCCRRQPTRTCCTDSGGAPRLPRLRPR